MRNVIVHGSRTGKFNLVYYSNSTPLSISLYDSKLLNVAKLNNTKTGLLWYRPNQNDNPFTTFELGNFYLIFAKRTFELILEDVDSTQNQYLTGDSLGKLNFIFYPYTTTRAVSSYGDAIKEVQFISDDISIITSYSSNRAINQHVSLEQQAILVKATSDIIIYNFDKPALTTENSDFILLEQNSDRLIIDSISSPI